MRKDRGFVRSSPGMEGWRDGGRREWSREEREEREREERERESAERREKERERERERERACCCCTRARMHHEFGRTPIKHNARALPHNASQPPAPTEVHGANPGAHHWPYVLIIFDSVFVGAERGGGYQPPQKDRTPSASAAGTRHPALLPRAHGGEHHFGAWGPNSCRIGAAQHPKAHEE